MKKDLNVVELDALPPFDQCDTDTVYVLRPLNFSLQRYHERRNRNLGWITLEDQEKLRGCTVAIAGGGGMGGLVIASLARLGVSVKVADPEAFDDSNSNRQFGAKLGTIGVNKALATAAETRLIVDDTTITVYPMGIRHDTVKEFVEGADLICDLIEYWIFWYRALLHRQARKSGVDVLVCDTVGYSTNLFLYTPTSMTVEESAGITLEAAERFRARAASTGLTDDDRRIIMKGMNRAVIPGGIPEYGTSGVYSTAEAFTKRLSEEGTASIIGTNPIMAAGFLLNHILFQLLKGSPSTGSVLMPPPMPGYLFFDAATMESKTVTGQWW